MEPYNKDGITDNQANTRYCQSNPDKIAVR